VRENLATLYAAVEQGFASPLPTFPKDELEGYLACGVLARGFAIVQCESAECRQRNSSPFAAGPRFLSVVHGQAHGRNRTIWWITRDSDFHLACLPGR
jgi:hypothetical protein